MKALRLDENVEMEQVVYDRRRHSCCIFNKRTKKSYISEQGSPVGLLKKPTQVVYYRRGHSRCFRPITPKPTTKTSTTKKQQRSRIVEEGNRRVG